MPLGGDLGPRQEGEELRCALVVRRRLAGKHPQPGAADHAVVRRALDVVVVRQLRDAEIELGIPPELGDAGRGRRQHGALAAGEALLAFEAPPAVGEVPGARPGRQERYMAHHEVAVEDQPGVQPAQAVVFGGEILVVPGAHVFDVHPCGPGRGVNALQPGIQQRAHQRGHLVPGARQLVRIQLRFAESVLVIEQNRRRDAERQPEQAAGVIEEVAAHGGEEGLRIQLLAGFGQHLPRRPVGALRRHQVRSAQFVDLHDIRAGAVALRLHGLDQAALVAALVLPDNAVILLRFVEALHQRLQHLAQRAAHGVPKANFRLRLGAARESNEKGSESYAHRVALYDAAHASQSRADGH